jgi:hypothetical protein
MSTLSCFDFDDPETYETFRIICQENTQTLEDTITFISSFAFRFVAWGRNPSGKETIVIKNIDGPKLLTKKKFCAEHDFRIPIHTVKKSPMVVLKNISSFPN